MDIGDRVRVHISEGRREAYAMGCAESLHGKTGTVIKHNKGVFRDGGARGYGHHYIEPDKCLVQFDTPPEKWWSNQRPSNGFWFSFQDLAED